MRNLFSKVTMITLVIFTFLSGAIYAQNRQISGKVVDPSGEAIVGASVVLVGSTSTGTVTDLDGSFALNVPNGSTLSVSCIGYTTETITVGSASTYTITLSEDSEFLEETVVIGYGVQKKSDITGAIASVKSEDMANRTSTDVAQALQGKAAGVQIINSTGAPGSESTIQIRGYSSNSKTKPLMIVDGLKVNSIDYLDPENIESMEVLKDAASAAIYGIEAGNGVILITTKAGKKSDEGFGEIFYNFQQTWQQASHIPDMLNAKEFMEYQLLSGGAANMERFNYDGHTDTNWIEEMLETGHMGRHTIGFRGGDRNGSLYVSLTSTNNNGIIAGDKDTFNRLTGQINADYKIKKWFTVGVTTSFEKRQSTAVTESQQSHISTIGSMLTMDPITPWVYNSDSEVPQYVKDVLSGVHSSEVPLDPNGKIYGVSTFCGSARIWHPAVMRDKQDVVNSGFNVRGTAYANLTPVKGLTITSRLGYRAGYSMNSTYNYPVYLNAQSNQQFSINGRSSNNLYYQWENFANYMFDVQKNSFTVMAGMSFESSHSDYVYGSADKLTDYSPSFHYLSNAVNSSAMTIQGVPTDNANLSYFGRLSWSYDNRYNLQANFRADAYDTSKLDKSSRWGYFPSISAGWNLGNEKFMRPILDKAHIDVLKFRASYGINGNVNAIGNYQYLSTVEISAGNGYDLGGTYYPAVRPSSVLANPSLRWETSRQLDLGVDLRMFKNKLVVGLDWYNKNTVDLITSQTAPGNTGTNTIYINAGKVNNHGLELEATWKDNIGDFGYSVSGNIATVNNMVMLGTSADRVEGQRVWGSQYVTYFEEGYPLWYLRTFVVDHVDPETGRAVYKDIDKNGVINADDREMTGSGIPDFTYGLTLNLSYKNFDLLIFGTGAQGAEKLFALNRQDFAQENTLREFYVNAWRPDNQTNYKYPKPDVSDLFYKTSDTFVFDASFFKIKQIQLGYTIPKQLLKKVGMTNLRAYVSLDDWFTFTKYPGLDPETSAYQTAASGLGVDYGAYPISKKVVFGLNVSF